MTAKLKKEVEVLTEQLTKAQAKHSALWQEHQALSYIHLKREIEIAQLQSQLKRNN